MKYSETIKKENVSGTPVNSVNSLNLGMDTSGFNIKSDVLNLKNGVGSNLNLALGSVVSSQQQQPTSATIAANNNINNHTNIENAITETAPTTTTTGKKKKKKAPKKFVEKKPRPKPGEIRETKALDGSTLFCCPECQMAYPDRSLIEQHVISHAVERR